MHPSSPRPRRLLGSPSPAGVALALVLMGGPAPAGAQLPRPDEVRQIVSFSFLPGRAPQALDLYRERALPLYRDDLAMLSFRGFREVESPVPLDLVVVSSFEVMGGIDDYNQSLSELAEVGGTSIAEIYGEIAAPSASPLTALVWYRLAPGTREAFETALVRTAAWESDVGIPSATGRLILSDGWDYLRFLGFDSLAAYHEYWREASLTRGWNELEAATLSHRQVILSRLPELDVR
ncbi:MAG: hypothetical protein P8188_17650 [Gemmatimonadota bacterium]